MKNQTINIGLSVKERNGVCAILNTLVADETVLYIKTRKFHWNVVGKEFKELHLLFEAQYGELEIAIDLLAERIRKLGGNAEGTMKEYLSSARLKEHPGKYPTALLMIEELLADHESCIRSLRQDIEKTDKSFHDAGTTDLLTGLIRGHEKTAWMLRSYIS